MARRTDVVWLAVPFFDRGQFAGNYLAAVSMDRALAAMVPGWFMQEHRVQLLRDDSAGGAPTAYRVGLNLPGTDLFAQVDETIAQPTTVPRIFFLVALFFLSGMLVSLYALRRDIVKRQQVQALLQAQVALRTAMENSVTIGLRAWDFERQHLVCERRVLSHRGLQCGRADWPHASRSPTGRPSKLRPWSGCMTASWRRAPAAKGSRCSFSTATAIWWMC